MTMSLAQMIAAARSEVTEIPPADGEQAQLIVDVREPHEYREGHLPGALNVPRGVLELRADPASPVTDPELSADPSARILVYCTKNPGARSLLAAQTLARMGYGRVEVLAGGLNAWAEAGLPVEAETQAVSS